MVWLDFFLQQLVTAFAWGLGLMVASAASIPAFGLAIRLYETIRWPLRRSK